MKRKIIIVLWAVFVLGWLGVAMAFYAISKGWIGYLPPIEQLQNPIDKYASQVISSDDKVIGSYAHSGDNRIFVPYEEISPNLINALIATEDVRYHEHAGIDFRGLGRAIVKTGILRQKGAGGGSTITQQLAKLLYTQQAKSRMGRVLQKPIEWVIAVQLERFYTKEEILTMYLNQFDFLYNAVGIRSAAQTYFSKKPSELNLEEAAMLVGMCKNPSLYNPILHKDSDRPLLRRNVVFEQMAKAGMLTQVEADSLSGLPVVTKFRRMTHKEGVAPYMREHLRRIMMAKEPSRSDYASWQMAQYSADSLAWETNPLYGWCYKNKKSDGSYYNIYTDGLKIHTTVNAQMQEYAEAAVREHMAGTLQPAFDREKRNSKTAPFASNITAEQKQEILNRAMRQSERWRASKEEGMSDAEIKKSFREKTKMQLWSWQGVRDTLLTPMDSILHVKSLLRTGFMAMNPHTGDVLAYVGGIDFSHFQYDMVANGRRQVGSTIKPYLYSLSMVDGYSPCDEVLHVQPHIRLESGQIWRPRNANNRRIGEMVSIQWGLQYSDNWVTAELMSRTTPLAFRNLLKSYGLAGPIEATPAMSLGTPEATVGEMVSGYTTFINRGIRVAPRLVTHIEDQSGNIVATFSPEMSEVLPQAAADKMLYMLQNVVRGGTGSGLRSRFGLTMPLGGKTGTTNKNSDAWFMGFTPDIVAGCWVGGEDPSVRFSSMAFGQGARAAMPIFALFIKKVYADKKLGYRTDATFNLPNNFAPCSDASYTTDGSVEIFESVAEDEIISDLGGTQ
ncbi:transglycosylase domain-containing protein [Porphyromonas sp. COT-290 OH860]|uniref:transglycosylase domain-containing protein n=1 Tax=Porphyromonas sp. COT-290 OH860 TaxID=1515615 RepID=UPI00052C2C4E|nr:transglycosylase domain-containing protein [Porphyromonas sp. COT-290 OH860]KGN82548.1 penicillin-binding protein [Porphyromonas sp. COT-290 OH860]